MKFTTVWGILPVIIGKSKDAWGHAKGPYIALPDNTENALVQHELFHVKQWYVWLFFVIISSVGIIKFSIVSEYAPFVIIGAVIFSALAYGSKYGTMRRETAAYGESLRTLQQTFGDSVIEKNVSHYAKAMTLDEYNISTSVEKLEIILRKRFKDGYLF